MIKGLEALDKLSPPVAEKLIKHQEQIYQLHETLNTLRLDKQNALVRRLVRKQQDGTLGQEGLVDAEAEEITVNDPEGEKVTFGDTTTYNVSQPAQLPSASRPIPLWPFILAAALGGTGLGVGAMSLLRTPSGVVPTTIATDLDTDTTYDLIFKEESE